VTFAVEAEIYDRFVGRYGDELGRELARVAGVRPGMRALDVGAGTGKLTGVLAELLGEENVAAVDPSEPFVAALASRFPDVAVEQAAAETLPFADSSFDAVFAQLVVNFLRDPEQGVGEMIRVTREGGAVAAAVWDYPGEMTLLNAFWKAADSLDGADAHDERTTMRFDEQEELADFWRALGLRAVEDGDIVASASYESFDDLWEPFRAGVGPAGAHAVSLPPTAQEELKAEFHRRLGSPEGSFELQARAWYAVGTK
jgi:ubiquinone/menaquinone biosynthesis C-methylase UbiE